MDDNFDKVTTFLLQCDTFDDLDLRTIKLEDVYGTPISYGDPFAFLHIMPTVNYATVGVVHSIHTILQFQLYLHTRYKPWYTERLSHIRHGVKMISHQNVQRLCREYTFFHSFANVHLFMTPRNAKNQ